MDVIQPGVNNIMYENLKERSKCHNPKHFIHKLRLIKSPSEIELMRQSCNIAAHAFVETISGSQPGKL